MENQLLAKVVNLHISSYIGTAIGATHFYGELQMRGEGDVELFNVLTTKQAIRLRKEGYSHYEAGDKYRGFECKDDAIAEGKRVWKEHFPDAQFLVLGKVIHIEPKKLLDAPNDDVIAEVNAIVDEYDERMKKYEGRKNLRKPISMEDERFFDDSYKEWVRLLNEAITN